MLRLFHNLFVFGILEFYIKNSVFQTIQSVPAKICTWLLSEIHFNFVFLNFVYKPYDDPRLSHVSSWGAKKLAQQWDSHETFLKHWLSWQSWWRARLWPIGSMMYPWLANFKELVLVARQSKKLLTLNPMRRKKMRPKVGLVWMLQAFARNGCNMYFSTLLPARLIWTIPATSLHWGFRDSGGDISSSCGADQMICDKRVQF